MSGSYPRPYEDGESTEFDFVIVGGGTAGLVLATRLAPHARVAVIEAGDYHPDDELINVPSNLRKAWANPKYDWCFRTVPQEALTSEDQTVVVDTGKMLGGSSGLNLLGWTRGSRQDYDAWEELGNPGWNWETMRHYLSKVETAHPPQPQDVFPGSTLEEMSHKDRGAEGPIHLTYNSWGFDILSPFVRAAKAVGLKCNADSYNGDVLGVRNAQVNVNPSTGTRSYAANAYYDLVKSEAKLRIFVKSMAGRIIFEDGSKPLLARSVELLTGDRKVLLTARREVILSAGAFKSPGVLELSGIGNSSILTKAGVSPLYDLPSVGENLQDHPRAAPNWVIDPSHITMDTFREDPAFRAEQHKEYEKHKRGMFATSIPCGALSYAPVSLVAAALGAQTEAGQILQRATELIETAPTKLLRKQYELQHRWLQEESLCQIEMICVAGGAIDTEPGARYLTIFSCVASPFSRGNIHIVSNDPMEYPRIDVGYLREKADEDIIVLGLAYINKIVQTPPLVSSIKRINTPSTQPTSLDEWRAFAKKSIYSLHHQLGTCPMAPEEDGGVVSPELVVYGTENVRVIDASVIPMMPAAHTQATVYAIAEKAADMIKAKYSF